MDNAVSYRVILEDAGPQEYREKASRFLGYAVTCETPEDVTRSLQLTRKKHFDATHVCYAFRLRTGPQDEIRRSSDDGEPSGTAGLPIMQEIMARDLWNLLVMVVRYYGGTKLGTGGLVRAYSTAAKAVLDSCPQKEVACTLDGRVSYAYTDTGLVMHWLSRFRGTIVHQDCSGQGMIMTCQFPINDAPDAGQALIDMSGGRLRWEEGKG